MSSLDIQQLRNLVESERLLWQTHCLERMQERDISVADVLQVIENGEIIEEYPTDYPHPSCLIFGETLAKTPLHVVAGTDGQDIYFITAYVPNNIIFEEDFKTRRSK